MHRVKIFHLASAAVGLGNTRGSALSALVETDEYLAWRDWATEFAWRQHDREAVLHEMLELKTGKENLLIHIYCMDGWTPCSWDEVPEALHG